MELPKAFELVFACFTILYSVLGCNNMDYCSEPKNICIISYLHHAIEQNIVEQFNV